MGAQYAIMRFAKYKGGAIGGIEAHNERKKEKYSSNPDVDTSRSDQNYHLISPPQSYRAECNKQISEANCRVRSDSVKMVEVLITASPEFFQDKNEKEVRAYFEEALTFLKGNLREDTIISATVHMDEKTPHMHLVCVPITRDNRLSAKEIVGNRKKLTKWQDDFWSHMVRKFPDLERGESASKTGRTHIPPRLYKEATHLAHQREMLLKSLHDVNAFNAKKKAVEIEQLLESFIPGIEKLKTEVDKYDAAYKALLEEKKQLDQKVGDLSKDVMDRRIKNAQAMAELENLRKLTKEIPPEILQACRHRGRGREEER